MNNTNLRPRSLGTSYADFCSVSEIGLAVHNADSVANDLKSVADLPVNTVQHCPVCQNAFFKRC